jgi:hypothetical protein
MLVLVLVLTVRALLARTGETALYSHGLGAGALEHPSK